MSTSPLVLIFHYVGFSLVMDELDFSVLRDGVVIFWEGFFLGDWGLYFLVGYFCLLSSGVCLVVFRGFQLFWIWICVVVFCVFLDWFVWASVSK